MILTAAQEQKSWAEPLFPTVESIAATLGVCLQLVVSSCKWLPKQRLEAITLLGLVDNMPATPLSATEGTPSSIPAATRDASGTALAGASDAPHGVMSTSEKSQPLKALIERASS